MNGLFYGNYFFWISINFLTFGSFSSKRIRFFSLWSLAWVYGFYGFDFGASDDLVYELIWAGGLGAGGWGME